MYVCECLCVREKEEGGEGGEGGEGWRCPVKTRTPYLGYGEKQTNGNNPQPVCCTFKELKTGKQETHWYVGENHKWPYEISETLWICHNPVAEVSCMLELGLERPDRVWDTMVQDKKLNLGIENRFNLLACCERFGIETITEAQKKLSNLIMDFLII